MMMLIQKFVRPIRNIEGATAIEYGLIASLISVVMIAGATLVGTNVLATFNAVAAAM